MDMNQTGREIDKSNGHYVGQIVRFFNPWNGDRSEQIADGKVIEVNHTMQTLTVFIRTAQAEDCLLYTSPSPRDLSTSRMPSSA